MIRIAKKEKMSVSKATSTLIALILKMPPSKIMDTLHYVERQCDDEPIGHSNTPASQAEVVFSVDKKFCKGIARSIEPSGMFIETQENFFPGKCITLSYENKDKGQQVKTTGKIVSVTVEGIGVAFDSLS